MGKSDRSVVRIDEDRSVFIKQFVDDPSGEALAAEVLAREVFGDCSWMTPILERSVDTLVMPLYPRAARLDVVARSLSGRARREVALQALRIAFDIHARGFAHRDFHSGNLFLVDGALRLVDFETLTEADRSTPFREAYDLVGTGLPSPYRTANACYSKRAPGMIGNDLGVPLGRALRGFEDELKEQVRAASVSFATKRTDSGRHVRKSDRPFYSSLETQHLTLPRRGSQRDTMARLREFGIGPEDVAGRTVLDLGCFVGAVSLQMAALGATSCVGLEYDAGKLDVARALAAYAGLADRVEWIHGDLDHPPRGRTYDIVLCLAVDRHVADRRALAAYLAEVTGQLLLFEGNSGTDPAEVEALLREGGFARVTHRGMSNADARRANRDRPILVAAKG